MNLGGHSSGGTWSALGLGCIYVHRCQGESPFVELSPGHSPLNLWKFCIGGRFSPWQWGKPSRSSYISQRRTFLIPMNGLSLICGVPLHFGITCARGHTKVTSCNGSNLGNYACQRANLAAGRCCLYRGTWPPNGL